MCLEAQVEPRGTVCDRCLCDNDAVHDRNGHRATGCRHSPRRRPAASGDRSRARGGPPGVRAAAAGAGRACSTSARCSRRSRRSRSRVLPHDRLTMTLHDGEQGSFVAACGVERRWADGGAGDGRGSGRGWSDGFFKIIDDLTLARARRDLRPARSPRSGSARPATDRCWRSACRRAISSSGCSSGRSRWTRSRREQVPIARRIAEHVALAVSHQQLAEAVSARGRSAGARRAARGARPSRCRRSSIRAAATGA